MQTPIQGFRSIYFVPIVIEKMSYHRVFPHIICEFDTILRKKKNENNDDHTVNNYCNIFDLPFPRIQEYFILM